MGTASRGSGTPDKARVASPVDSEEELGLTVVSGEDQHAAVSLSAEGMHVSLLIHGTSGGGPAAHIPERSDCFVLFPLVIHDPPTHIDVTKIEMTILPPIPSRAKAL